MAMQDFRAVLRRCAVIELPPSKQPPRFDAEGKVLVQVLEQTLRRIEAVVGELVAAIEEARPYLLKERTDGFGQVHLRLNRALSAANGLLPLLRKQNGD
jgi:hypothetical protein